MKIRIIFHAADWDGKLSGAIAHHWLKDYHQEIEMVPWDFGDKPVAPPDDTQVDYILDLPVDKVYGVNFTNGFVEWPDGKWQPIDRWDVPNTIWIDHHKSSIETHPQNIPGYRIDGVAACRLAWQWFVAESKGGYDAGFSLQDLPDLTDYVNRYVIEPVAVRLAGEHDVGDRREAAARFLNEGLTATPDVLYNALFAMFPDNAYTTKIIEKGKTVVDYLTVLNAEICKSRMFEIEFENLTFFCVNTARFNSLLFASVDRPEFKHDALMGFCFDGKGWLVSMYHAEHRKDLDLSEIAKKYGGGGHRGACGFRCKELPFAL